VAELVRLGFLITSLRPAMTTTDALGHVTRELRTAGAHEIRETVRRDGMIARVPNPEEYDFLRFLHKKFGYGKGRPVGYHDYPGA
jgi:hypothetical protein